MHFLNAMNLQQCIALLKNSGDGIDFDWEHLSEDPLIKTQQRQVLAKVMVTLRSALEVNGMNDKLITYTTRFNAFWSTPPVGVDSFASDGEGVDIFNEIKALGQDPNTVINLVNIMMYDVPPNAFHSDSNKWTLQDYQLVLNYFANYISKNKLVMGFEPGKQAADGVWCGMTMSKQIIDYVASNGFAGVMFWAINDANNGGNAQTLAEYASLSLKK